jgi:Glyoxalase/Bleomycin resistance protein/Dioxygenase superfamily
VFPRPNATHSQVAYVTNDLDRALALFRDDYDVPSFYVFTNDAPGMIQSDGAKLKIALALVGGVEIELIEPQGETAPLFSAPLPMDGRFGIRFHHVAFRIAGGIADFEAHMASIDPEKHPVVWHGRLGEVLRYAYTDERATLGHYVEHVWMHPDLRAQIAGAIPVYPAVRGVPDA